METFFAPYFNLSIFSSFSIEKLRFLDILLEIDIFLKFALPGHVHKLFSFLREQNFRVNICDAFTIVGKTWLCECFCGKLNKRQSAFELETAKLLISDANTAAVITFFRRFQSQEIDFEISLGETK